MVGTALSSPIFFSFVLADVLFLPVISVEFDVRDPYFTMSSKEMEDVFLLTCTEGSMFSTAAEIPSKEFRARVTSFHSCAIHLEMSSKPLTKIAKVLYLISALNNYGSIRIQPNVFITNTTRSPSQNRRARRTLKF